METNDRGSAALVGTWFSAGGGFVGRAAEVAALSQRVDDGARLVTVTGAAGIGKTRLALEWSRDAKGAGKQVIFCDLSESRGIDDACAVVGRGLGVPLRAGGTVDEVVAQLGRALAELGRCVLVLDNLEQLVALAPRLLGPWFSLAPGATLVVTSRERLRLDDEVCLPIEPLAPADAAALFVMRSRAGGAVLDAGGADALLIAAIVGRLDGIPLAIELCAARTGVLAPRQILARLSHRFDLLVTGSRGANARMATLRGALDWSWDLLTLHEQVALAQCSVFVGGFSIDAAEAVLDLGEAPPVLDVLQSLHDKSLLRTYGVRDGGERRCGLLESIREYAAARLDELGGGDAAVARHTAYFLGLAGPLTIVARPPDARRVALEVDNLLAVCTRALASRPLTATAADSALRGLLLLEPVLLTCAEGRLEPYVALLDAALAVPAPRGSVVRTRALYTRGLADLFRGRMLDCALAFHRAREEARAAGSAADEAMALTKLGVLFDRAGQDEEARKSFEAARVITVDLGDPSLHADWALSYAGALHWRGQPADALWHAEVAAVGFAAVGDPRGQALAGALVALAQLNLGRWDEAEAAAAPALALREATQDRRTEAYVLTILGRVDQARGRFGEARRKLTKALTIDAAVGDQLSEGVLRGYLGDVAFEEGLIGEAQAAYRGALAQLHDSGERHQIAVFRGALGATFVALRDLDGAAGHLQAASAGLDRTSLLVTRVIVEIQRGHLEAALARRAAEAGDMAAVELHRRAMVAAIACAEAPAADGTLALARCSEDVRTALRLLQGQIARHEVEAPPTVVRQPAGAPMIVVGTEARWFRVGHSDTVQLSRARAARLMLFALVRRRVDAPGRALALADLFSAGWPGERIGPKPAANRVYVTLTKLRRLGLGPLIVSRDDGFLLDPGVTVIEALEARKGP